MVRRGGTTGPIVFEPNAKSVSPQSCHWQRSCEAEQRWDRSGWRLKRVDSGGGYALTMESISARQLSPENHFLHS